MIATDMLYFAWPDGHDGGAMGDRLAQPEGLHRDEARRAEAFPLRRRRRHLPDPRHDHGRHDSPAGRAAGSLALNPALLDDYVAHVLKFIDPSIVKPSRRLDAGSGWRARRAKLFETLACPHDDALLRPSTARSPHEANPSSRRTGRISSNASSPERAEIASPGTATPTAASSSTRRRVIPGDFVTALLAEAFLMKERGAAIVYDVRAATPSETPSRVRRPAADEPRGTRVLQEAHAGGERRVQAAR